MLKEVDCVRVTIDFKLTWKEHIKQVLAKSNASLAFLRRNLRTCSWHIKEHCYKTSVCPIIEYAASIWAPHTTQDVEKIEMLQRRAVRFICNNYYRNTSFTNLSLDSLGWPSLKSRRSYLKLNLTYKILNNLICIPYDNFKPVTYYTCGCQHHLQCTYDSYRYSFFSSAIWLWNSLPLNTATCNDVDEFDQKLKNHFWIIFYICIIPLIEACILPTNNNNDVQSRRVLKPAHPQLAAFTQYMDVKHAILVTIIVILFNYIPIWPSYARGGRARLREGGAGDTFDIVSRSQTTFFSFMCEWEKRSGKNSIALLFWQLTDSGILLSGFWL